MNSPEIEIQLINNQLKINDLLIEFPVHREVLEKLFGKPSRLYYDNNWKAIWDNLGIYTDYAVWDKIYRIKFLQKPYPVEDRSVSTGFFSGKLYIDGKEIFNEKVERLTRNSLVFNQFKYQESYEPFGFTCEYNHGYQKEIPADKYTIKATEEEVIHIQDFNFKLLVIDELMYKQKELLPEFDLYEFVKWYKKRKIDIEKEGYDEIEEVTKFFQELPITKAQAAKVTNLQQDGGNRVYGEIQRFWSGEDEKYDIINLADALQFPNLKKITCFATNIQAEAQQNSIDQIRAKNIEVAFF